MNTVKTGALIRRLRLERGLTQNDLAKRLQLSDRTISKWERGCGLPDVSLLRSVSEVLDVDVQSLLSGELNPNDIDGGNMKRLKFYRCSSCGNLLTSTSAADISCCGRTLEPLECRPAEGEHAITVEEVEDEYLISIDHEMTKDHHIAFFACGTDERVMIVRQYPEQSAEARFPYIPHGTWYIGCTEHGLFSVRR